MSNFFSERAKQVKSGEYNPPTLNNQVTESQSVKNTVAVKPIQINKWDKEIHPIIEKFDLQKAGVSYETTKFMRNVYNGKYDAVASEIKESNPNLYSLMEKLKRSSNEFTTELKKSNPDLNKALDSYAKSAKLSKDFFESFNSNDNAAYRISDRNGSILKAKDYAKQNQEYQRFDDLNSTDVRVVKKSSGPASTLFSFLFGSDEGSNQTVSANTLGKTYDFLKGKDAEAMSALRTAKNSKTSMWLEQALVNADGNVNSKNQYNSTLLSMGQDLLDRIVKYGTKTDPDMKKADQSKASELLKTLNSFEDTPEGVAKRVNFLIKNNETLKSLNGRLGYYETSYLYGKYKNQTNKNDLFINPTRLSNKSAYLDELNWIDKMEDTYSKFKGNASTIKGNVLKTISSGDGISSSYLRNAKDLSGKAYSDAVLAIADQNGDIVSYQKFVDKVYPLISKMPIVNPITIGGRAGLDYDEDYEKNQKRILHNHLTDLYKNLSKGYKETLDYRKQSFDHEASLLGQGIGAVSRKGIGFESVNLKTDKEGRLNSFSGLKQKNVLDVWSLIRNEDGTFGNSNAIIVPANNKDQIAELNTLDKSTMYSMGKESDKRMKEFLKSNPDDVKFVFLRDSNVPGYAQYRMINNETKQSVVAMIKHSVLRDSKEPMFMASRQSIDEINFAMENKKKLIEVTDSRNRPIIENPYFTWDRDAGLYKLHGTLKSNKSKVALGDYSKPYYAPAGSSLKEATEYFDDLMNRLKD